MLTTNKRKYFHQKRVQFPQGCLAEDLKENGVVKKSRDSQRFRAKLADTRETNKEQN